MYKAIFTKFCFIFLGTDASELQKVKHKIWEDRGRGYNKHQMLPGGTKPVMLQLQSHAL